MNNEKQRIAIAEACGIRRIPSDFSEKAWVNLDGRFVGIGIDSLPDYLNDLNAMHKAEKVLAGGMRSKYDAELTLICSRDYNFIWESDPAQRAEAFLRTIGKWAID